MSDSTLGDGPVPAGIRIKMNAIAAVLDELLNGETAGSDESQWGFVVMCFPFGEGVATVSLIRRIY